jgi:hypothetical protein
MMSYLGSFFLEELLKVFLHLSLELGQVGAYHLVDNLHGFQVDKDVGRE